MTKNKGTPEEELLSLIEKDSDSDISSAILRRKRKFLFSSVFNIKRHCRFLSELVRTVFSKISGFLREPDLKAANKALAVVILLLGCYLLIDFIARRENIDNIYKKACRIEEETEVMGQNVEALPFLYYLEMVQRRNIFSPVELEGKEKRTEKKQEDLAKLIEGLKLVGIAWGKNPQAMIEDDTDKKTYFLNKGDTIRKFNIHSISKNKVVLSYEDKKIDLK